MILPLFHRLGKLAALTSLEHCSTGNDSFSEGISDEGATSPHRDDSAYRLADNISRAFAVNANLDQPADSSSSIGEPGMNAAVWKVASGETVSSSSVVMPPTSTATTKAPSIKGAVDPRTDKPPGQNLQHGLQTVAYGQAMGDAYTSFARRLQGSPV